MILVTGGTGMLGARLLFDLVSRGEQVRAILRKSSDMGLVRRIFSWYGSEGTTLFDAIEWVEADMLDRDSLRPALAGVDKIFHLAALVSFDPRERAQMIHINSEGTLNIAELAIEEGVQRFCHVSSIAALGETSAGIVTNEAAGWSSDSHHSAYSESKFRSEMEVWRTFYNGLEGVIVNPSVILGPGNWHNGSPKFFETIDKGLRFYTIGGTGFVDAADVSRAMIELLFHREWEKVKGNRFILNSCNLLYRDFFNKIADSLGKPRPKYQAGVHMMNFVWRLLKLGSWFTGKPPLITRDTARSSSSVSLYDGSKIDQVIGFRYTPIDHTIQKIADIYIKERRNNR